MVSKNISISNFAVIVVVALICTTSSNLWADSKNITPLPHSGSQLAKSDNETLNVARIARPVPLNTIIDINRGAVIVSILTAPSNEDLFYQFALDKNGEFLFPRIKPGSIIDTIVFATFDSIRSGITYAWRCRAFSPDFNDTSEWSPVTVFDMEQGVRPLVGHVDYPYPTEGLTVQGTRPTFSIKELHYMNQVYNQVGDNVNVNQIIESSVVQTREGYPTFWWMNNKYNPVAIITRE